MAQLWLATILCFVLLLALPKPLVSPPVCSIVHENARCGCSAMDLQSLPPDRAESLADYATDEDVEYYYIDDMAFRKDRFTTPSDDEPTVVEQLNPSFWPGGIIFYIVDDGFSKFYRKLILSAMDEIQTRVGFQHLEFREAQLAPGGPICRSSYLHVIKADKHKCVSEVGMQLRGLTRLWLNQQSCSLGTIQHELLHALGRYHEQCRPDRDKYVMLLPQNMIDTQCSNYKFFTYDGMWDPGLELPYDTYSIMHYGSCYFTCNGNYTMLRRDGSKVWPNRQKLTAWDVEKVRRMFPTNARTPFQRSYMHCRDKKCAQQAIVVNVVAVCTASAAALFALRAPALHYR